MAKIVNKDIKLQILKESYWEHFKMAKELAMTLDVKHFKRVRIEIEINNIQQQINKIL